MSVFYLLPTRAEVAGEFARYLASWFPGSRALDPDLADQLVETALAHADAFAVFADELPVDGDIWPILSESFGAALGDSIVDLRRGPGSPADQRPSSDRDPSDNFRPRLAQAC